MYVPYSINIEGHIRARVRDIKYFMGRVRDISPFHVLHRLQMSPNAAKVPQGMKTLALGDTNFMVKSHKGQ